MKWDSIVKAIGAAAGAVVGFLCGEINGLFISIIALEVNSVIINVWIFAFQRSVASFFYMNI